MKILVTGSAGFVGSATVTELQAHDHEVIEYDLMGGYDIRDQRQFTMLVSENQPDRILHLAAIARFADADRDPMTAHSTNVLGTQIVARVAHRYHVPVVYASTGSVYMPIGEEPPITEDFRVAGNSIYAVTKLLGELHIRQSSSPWIVLRYAHLYGSEKRGHGLIGGFIERIERGLAPTLFGGRQSNDFTYITDVARANRLALEASYDRWGQVYNIGTGEELTAEDAGRMVCQAWEYHGDTLVNPARGVDPQRFVYDTAKATRMLGFTAEYSFRMGLADMVTRGDVSGLRIA
jgi:nucleoside-diphosphate-sugar epimerase